MEYGGRLVFTVDFTPGGAPIGLPVRSLEAYLQGDFDAGEEDDDLCDLPQNPPFDGADQDRALDEEPQRPPEADRS